MLTTWSSFYIFSSKKYIKFDFQNLENRREDRNGHRLLLVLIKKTMFPIDFSKIELFSLSKPEVVYLPPFLSSLPFPKFYLFWRKTYTLIERNGCYNDIYD